MKMTEVEHANAVAAAERMGVRLACAVLQGGTLDLLPFNADLADKEFLAGTRDRLASLEARKKKVAK